MTTVSQDKSFRDEMFDSDLLERAIEWIRTNMETVDVFTKKQLEDWAENNGYIKEE